MKSPISEPSHLDMVTHSVEAWRVSSPDLHRPGAGAAHDIEGMQEPTDEPVHRGTRFPIRRYPATVPIDGFRSRYLAKPADTEQTGHRGPEGFGAPLTDME